MPVILTDTRRNEVEPSKRVCEVRNRKKSNANEVEAAVDALS